MPILLLDQQKMKCGYNMEHRSEKGNMVYIFEEGRSSNFDMIIHYLFKHKLT